MLYWFKNRIVLLNVLLVFVLTSCEFQPSEIPETFIEKPSDDAPVLMIDVEPEMDTLKLSTNVWARFRIRPQEAGVREVTILFDGNPVYMGGYDNNLLPQVFISIDNYTEGAHQFIIKVITKTNSGSIADKLGSEGYLYEANWPVIIHHNVDKQVDILNIDQTNGGVLINWEKYDYYDFEYYLVDKWSAIEGNGATYKITNPRINKLVDTTYIEGEYATYKVSVNGEYSERTEYSQPINAPDVFLNESNKIAVSWKKPQNRKMFGRYFCTVNLPNATVINGKTFYSINDTIAVFDTPGFGEKYKAQVRYVPKDYDYSPYLTYSSSGGVTFYSVGNKMHEFKQGLRIGSSDILLLYSGGFFYKCKAGNQTVIDSFQVSELTGTGFIRISPNGKFFSYFAANKFVMRKTENWGLINSFSVPFLNNGSLSLWNVSISDNFRLVVAGYGNVIEIIDILSGKEIFRKAFTKKEYLQDVIVNATGDKILYKLLVYSNNENRLHLVNFNGNSFTKVGDTYAAVSGAHYNVIQYAFLDDKVFLLKSIRSYDYCWEERSVSDFSLISKMNIAESFVPVAIDFIDKKLVTKLGIWRSYDNSYSLVYDFEKESVKKIVPIVGNRNFILSKETLSNGSGRFLSINDLIIKE